MKTFLKVLLWVGIVVAVVVLTLFIVAWIVPDFEGIGDLVNYLVAEFKAL